MDGDGRWTGEHVNVNSRRRTDAALLQVIDTEHPRRAEVEAFIAQRYLQVYAARVSSFMPTLFALLGPQSEICSAAGLRRASSGPLFVENYLDAPAEFVLAQTFGGAVDRRRLVEIGHLSGLGHGNGQRLFPMLARWLEDNAIDWALFAATGPLRAQFDRMQVRPQLLAPARPERLGAAAAEWGTYYDSNPWVVGGPLSLGARLLGPRA